MSKRLAVVAIAATAMMGFAVAQAPAGKKHSHKTLHRFVVTGTSVAPGSVGGGVATCPSGSVATGGGSNYGSGIATIQMGFASTNSYYILVDNFDSSIPAVNEVQVACALGTSRAKGREVSEAAAEQMVDQMAADLEAAHRASR